MTVVAFVAIRGSWSDTACARAVRGTRQLRDVIGPVRANVHRSSEEGARWDSQHVVSVVVSSRSILREAREWLNAVFSPLKIGYIGGRLVGVYVSCPGRVRRIWRFIRIGGVIEHVFLRTCFSKDIGLQSQVRKDPQGKRGRVKNFGAGG